MTTLLTINAGSSSIRLDLIDAQSAMRCTGSLNWKATSTGQKDLLVDFLSQNQSVKPEIVAHRIVHGGTRFHAATPIDDQVEQAIRELIPWAPLHLPAALSWLEASRAVLPAAAQVAVFDTDFFADLPDVASTYAISKGISDRLGIRRFGFHGLAHASMWRCWAGQHHGRGRVITLQLGSGCSIAALVDGHPLDTSMGFSPTEGLVMATRCGDLDPGLVLYLQRALQLDVVATERLLNEESGLLGLSGRSGDMQALCKLDEPAARHAFAVFTYRVKKYIGAYTAVLGGLDGLLFGGGIGEHSPEVRAACLGGLENFGIELDPAANAAACGGDARISRQGYNTEIFTVAVDEAGEMARQAFSLFNQSQAS